jgi:hypothetical protein
MYGMGRRQFLQLGASGLLLPDYFNLRAHSKQTENKKFPSGFGQAKSCIILFAWGGLSHLDSLDPKPDAESGIRGTFLPIRTATNGIQVSEHLPGFAKTTNEWAIVRSVHHNAPSHRSGAYWNLTGHEPPNLGGNWPASRDDWPSIGSMAWEALGDGHGPIPGTVALPYTLYDGGSANGQDAGFLGLKRDPAVVYPNSHGFRLYDGKSPSSGRIDLSLPEQLPGRRLRSRQGLLEQIEVDHALSNLDVQVEAHSMAQQKAFDLLMSTEAQSAFDLGKETQAMRESYGMHICGQSVLTARRLVEAGVPLATVYCAAGDLNGSKGAHFDTHADNFNRLKNQMLPPLDQAASALVRDLKQRGLLDETLVVLLTEFGRTPKIGGNAGRNHYPNCYSVAFAGGGINGGQAYGASDDIGAFPADKPCGPADLHATVFHALGIPSDHMIYDRNDRPLPMCDGTPLPLFG